MARGFTLIEVMVAVTIMAIMATLAWRGVDGLARAHEISAQRLAQVQQVNTALAQLGVDLDKLIDVPTVPAFTFDGASLRWVRSHDAGLQVVVWSLRAGAWWRWTSPPLTQQGALRDAWSASLRLTGQEREQLQVLPGVASTQAFVYRRNAWTNAQSSGDLVAPAGAPASAPTPREELPSALRLVIAIEGSGSLTRDWLLSTELR